MSVLPSVEKGAAFELRPPIIRLTQSCFCSKPGSYQEQIFELMTFGIPVQFMPVKTDGSLDMEHHKIWMHQRKNSEATKRCDDHQQVSCIIPGPKDVLFGRDKIAQSHPGNSRYLHLISTCQEEYDRVGSREERFVISTRILLGIKESGGRFLKFDGVGWAVVDDSTARDKVTNAFRSYRRKQNANAMKKDSVTAETIRFKRKEAY